MKLHSRIPLLMCCCHGIQKEPLETIVHYLQTNTRYMTYNISKYKFNPPQPCCLLMIFITTHHCLQLSVPELAAAGAALPR